jgi:isoamylase
MGKSKGSNLSLLQGTPIPLGVSQKEQGLNFALFSEHASGVTLCLFLPHTEQPLAEIPLNPEANKTGQVWHILIKGLSEDQWEYGFRISGPNETPGNTFDPKKLLLDPYAKGVNTGHVWGGKDQDAFRGKVILAAPFDWEGSKPPKLPPEDLVIYEMQVRGFTQDGSSKVKAPGTFLGIVEKIPYLKSLGVNAIELMPIFEFNECENKRINPKTHQKLQNFWGYSTINFFTPMNRFSSSENWTGAMDDFRTLVKEMHKNGIEVYLDVVYNHTAEGNHTGPFLSFKGIDNSVYYMVNPKGEYLDFSGTGNTFNANHPAVAQLILDSLRYWVVEMHVDGFRFDLASCLTRDPKGEPLAMPPLIEAISKDPVLADVKLIAEAWDAGGLYQVGFFPCEGRWFEWNGKYRDVVRRFLKGTDDQSGAFANAMSGSEDLYAKTSHPYYSINFVIAHDGYTLRDLVCYQEKHNLENGENNQDGNNQNESWNCGAEGDTKDPKIIQLRERQMRNHHAALMVAIGTPMILMGDEYGHTKNGNNNTYCQDNTLNWFLWDRLKEQEAFLRFYRLMIQFRHSEALLKRKEFLKDSDVTWHGKEPNKPNWGAENRFVAYTLNDAEHPLYIAFNASFEISNIQLPDPPAGKKWFLIVDTSLASPNDFCENPQSKAALEPTYDLRDHSALIAKAL